MSLRARIFVVISLVILLILGISIFLIISSRRKAAEQAQTASSTPAANVIEKNNFNATALQPTASSVPNGLPVKKLSALEVEQNAVKEFAIIFAERYGTYSTDSNFQNIKDVQDLVTTDLWSKLKTKIGTAPAGSFVGATTKVITADLAKWDGTSAQVQLQAVVAKEQNGAQTNVNQNISVTLIKTDGTWLVSDFTVK